MSLEELEDIERVKQHLGQVVSYQKLIEQQIDAIKTEVKEAQTDKQYGGVTAKYSKYVKLKPKSITDVITRYPVLEHPDLYNITLSKDAQHVITDEELFDTVEITSVRIELPN